MAAVFAGHGILGFTLRQLRIWQQPAFVADCAADCAGAILEFDREFQLESAQQQY